MTLRLINSGKSASGPKTLKTPKQRPRPPFVLITECSVLENRFRTWSGRKRGRTHAPQHCLHDFARIPHLLFVGRFVRPTRVVMGVRSAFIFSKLRCTVPLRGSAPPPPPKAFPKV